MWFSKVLFLDKIFPHTPQVKELQGRGGVGVSEGSGAAVLETSGAARDDTLEAVGTVTVALEAS